MYCMGYRLVFIKYGAYVQYFLCFGLLSALMLIKWGSNFQNVYTYIYTCTTTKCIFSDEIWISSLIMKKIITFSDEK